MTTLGELSDLVGGRCLGDRELELHGAGTLRDARPGEITLVENPQFLRHLANTSATAVVVPSSLSTLPLPALVVDDCQAAFAKIVQHFRPLPRSHGEGVSPAAQVDVSARIADGVTIYPGAWVDAQVTIGAGTVIHSGCRLLAGTVIGRDCVLFPNVVLYEGTRLGSRVVIHANAVIGGYGFGYNTVNGRHRLSAQLGYVEVGDDVEIGACTTVDRGTYGATVIGEGTKIDNQVMIAHNCRIGRHNLLCSQVGIAGSCTTGDYVVMAGQVGIRDHVEIGTGARLGAKSGVAADIPAGESYLGVPARPERDQRHIAISLIKLPAMRHQLKSLERMVAKLQRQLGLGGDPLPSPKLRDDESHAA